VAGVCSVVGLVQPRERRRRWRRSYRGWDTRGTNLERRRLVAEEGEGSYGGSGGGQRAYLRRDRAKSVIRAGGGGGWCETPRNACTFLSEKSPLGFRGAFFYRLSREEFSAQSRLFFFFSACGLSGAKGQAREA
jgi:hypothetical protein